MSDLRDFESLLDEEELVATDDSVIARAFWVSVAVLVIAGCLVGLVFWLARPAPEPPPQEDVEYLRPQKPTSTSAAPPGHFVEVARESGIDFVHENGARGDKLLPETMGGGCAFLDYDSDGDQDLLLVNGCLWPDDPRREERDSTPSSLTLYANDGSGAFTDVTEAAGLVTELYGTGVAIGDVDGDNDIDVFVCALGGNRLFANEGGRFRDVTENAGCAGDDDAWSTSACFFDADNDGDLDLFVCNYVNWSKEIDFAVDFRLTGFGRAYAPPLNYEGAHCSLYLGDGAGTFTDVSEAAGLHVNNPAFQDRKVPVGKALGVVPFDFDGDGWCDLFVANDTVRNFLFRNLGEGAPATFVEEGRTCGIAFGRDGQATGAMGVDIGHHREDGAVGIAVGNFANEMSSFLVAPRGDVFFTDEAIAAGIGGPSRAALSFGVFYFDHDLDGRLDLFQCNGHLEEEINVVQPSQHYRQPAQLFWNAGESAPRQFVLTEDAGDLAEPIVGRGAAYADIDADGDLDIVVTQVKDRALLFRNDLPPGAHWLRILLIGRAPNTSAIGAQLELEAGGRTQQRHVCPSRSYQSQVELPVTFGLGDTTEITRLTITWPDGTRTTVDDLAVDQQHAIHQ